MKRNDTNISRMPTVVAVCAILHNICEVHGDEFNQEWLTTEDDIVHVHNGNLELDNPTEDAEDIRTALMQYFS